MNFEVYQRFRLLPNELIGFGLFFDTGVYGSWVCANNHFMKEKLEHKVVKTETHKSIRGFNPLQWEYARLGYELIAIYGQYRFSDLFNEKMGKTELPRLEVGIELSIPFGSL